MLTREQKQQEIELLKGYFSKSQIALCSDYRGLNVGEITELRRSLREIGAVSRVVKNTFARISATDVLKEHNPADLEKFVDLLQGPTLLTFSFEDAVEPAKILAEFQKKHKTFEVKGAWLDGAFVDQASVDALSKLPSKEQLLGQLLSVMNAPATQLVRLLQTPATQLCRAVDAHRENLGKAA